MSTDDRIAMLQALLARVKSRARDDALAARPPPANGHARHADDDFFAAPPQSSFTAPPPSPLTAPPPGSLTAPPPSPLTASNPFAIATPMAAFRPSPIPTSPPSSPASGSPSSGPKFGLRPAAPPLSFAARGTLPPASPISETSLDRWSETRDEPRTEVPVPPRPPPPHPTVSGVHPLDLPLDVVPREPPPRDLPPRDPPPPDPPPMEVIELDVDPDPSLSPAGVSSPWSSPPEEERLESRSRLVSALPIAGDPDAEAAGTPSHADEDEDDEFDLEPGHVPSDPTIEMAPAQVSRAEREALEETIELEDRAPSSSRRPISMEEKMSELEDPVPLHTPPPASGKLPAASPAIELALDLPAESEPQPSPLPPPVPLTSGMLPRESLRAESATATEVAVFVGDAPGDRGGKTFGDLLDATLSL